MNFIILYLKIKVGIAQLVERQIVALKVVGSNPIIYPDRLDKIFKWDTNR